MKETDKTKQIYKVSWIQWQYLLHRQSSTYWVCWQCSYTRYKDIDVDISPNKRSTESYAPADKRCREPVHDERKDKREREISKLEINPKRLLKGYISGGNHENCFQV